MRIKKKERNAQRRIAATGFGLALRLDGEGEPTFDRIRRRIFVVIPTGAGRCRDVARLRRSGTERRVLHAKKPKAPKR